MTEERKDRLVQARVPERLETTLKEEARKQRTTVSRMIRNMLEDAFDLVDGVVANVDQIVSDSVELAQVTRDRLRSTRQGATASTGPGDPASEPPCGEPLSDAEERLAGIDAWNEVVLNRAAPCSRCGAELSRGRRVYAGLGTEPGASRDWLCRRAVDAMGEEAS